MANEDTSDGTASAVKTLARGLDILVLFSEIIPS